MRGEGAATALWVDPAVHADECRRFDSYVVKGPGPDDCDFFTGAIGTDGLRPHRYALARTLAAPLGADEFGLHECDMPLCVKVCGADAPRRHVVIGDQGDNMRRMARMRRGGGRKIIVGDNLRTRRERSVALRSALRERGWDREAVEAALIGDAPTLW